MKKHRTSKIRPLRSKKSPTPKEPTMDTFMPAKENRVDRAMQRIQKCADEMGIALTEDELDRFALIFCGMMDDAKELLRVGSLFTKT
jgi:hypothetical protein